MRAYIALIRKEDGTSYGVDFPDFPGCVSAGDTLAEALDGAREALTLYVEDMIAEGEALPAPSDLDAVMAVPHNSDAVAALVLAPEGARRWRRVNITMDEDLLARIDAAAGKGHRSEFLEEGARLLLAAAPLEGGGVDAPGIKLKGARLYAPGIKLVESPDGGTTAAIATGEVAETGKGKRGLGRKNV